MKNWTTKNWKVNLLISLVLIGLPGVFVYLYTLLPNSPLLMLLYAIIPLFGLIFAISVGIGAILLIAGIMGGARAKEAGSKKLIFIVLVSLALILYVSANSVLSDLR